jgi:hypothetical protein
MTDGNNARQIIITYIRKAKKEKERLAFEAVAWADY